jgi:hypothetical protein
MEKILVTGCTSSQMSVDANKRSTRFSGLVNTSLCYSGKDSVMMPVPMSFTEKDMSNFDSLIVGLSPFSSMSAHKSYNALHAISLAKKCGIDFHVIIDTPEPHLIFKSYDSIVKNPSLFTKNLYSNRDGFSAIESDDKLKNNLLDMVSLVSDADFKIIYPSVPYFEHTRESLGIPTNKNSSLFGFNFDKLFADNIYKPSTKSTRYWSVEDEKPKWSRNIVKLLDKPVIKLKRSQYDLEVDYIDRLQESYGYLVPVYKDEQPWWSRNIMLSLVSGVPVFSDWKHTQKLGEHWNVLPSHVENWSPEQRYELSVYQKISYANSLISWEESSKILTETVLS